MSWSDALKDAVGNVVGEAKQQVWPELVKKVMSDEGLQSLLAKLKDAGFQAQVQSWLDKNKDNLPITPEQIRKALGDQHVRQIVKSLGIPMSGARGAGEVPARGGELGRAGGIRAE